MYRHAGRHHNALRDKYVLLGENPYGKGSVGFRSCSQIAFDELAAQMKSSGINSGATAKEMPNRKVDFVESGRQNNAADQRNRQRETKLLTHARSRISACKRSSSRVPRGDTKRKHAIPG